MASELAGKTIAILITDGFEQSELAEPKSSHPAKARSGGGKTRIGAIRFQLMWPWRQPASMPTMDCRSPAAT